MYQFDPKSEWDSIHPKDLWVYNKLFLSRVMGYNCGPIGTAVPIPDFYIVRPAMNIMGMGRYSRKEYIYKYTDHYHPSEFWCEIFDGPHMSVDYYKKKSELVVFGEREINDPYYRWKKWSKLDMNVKFPEILNDLSGDYDWINCEFIGDNLIEVHFRQNPDFRYNNTEAIPVWKDEAIVEMEGYRYIEDEDFFRKGFYIK